MNNSTDPLILSVITDLVNTFNIHDLHVAYDAYNARYDYNSYYDDDVSHTIERLAHYPRSYNAFSSSPAAHQFFTHMCLYTGLVLSVLNLIVF